MSIRTRIAPSPTGDPHVGTAYIALFNYCFAKKHGGDFILRIEDTDQARSTPESEQAILKALNWLGLDWSEGPDVGGDFGPYRQSERSEIYAKYANELIEKGHAFRCYRTPQELSDMREARKAAGEHGALKPSDLKLPEEEIAHRKAANMPFVVRMIVPEASGPCPIEDQLRGTVELDWSQVDAQILIKSDGLPTYHLANVVDDHLMEISHVIRGEEWINSTPKHVLLYQYLGWQPPVFCHLPLLRNPDKSKLSKRKNPTSILYYQRMGFLPEALTNYLGRMGWSMPDEREKFSLQEMLDQFDITRVSLGGPIFDYEKLSWLNGLWIRENLDIQALGKRLHDWALNAENLQTILPHAQKRMNVLSDFIPLTAFLFSGKLPLNAESFSGLKLDDDQLITVLQFSSWALERLPTWEKTAIFETLKPLADSQAIKIKDFMAPLFIAISGTTASISVTDAMEILGPDMSRARLREAIELLGGVSKKRLKKLEKAFQSIESN